MSGTSSVWRARTLAWVGSAPGASAGDEHADARRRRVRRSAPSRCALGLLVLSLASPVVFAEGMGDSDPDPDVPRIVVADIVPALRGTEAGSVPVSAAPPLGGVRVVRRTEVLRALRAAGYSTRGLRIPARVRVRSVARRLTREALVEALSPAVQRALSPCALRRLRPPARMLVPEGAPRMVVERLSRPRPGSTRVSGVVRWHGERGWVRVPVTAEVRCPPPAVRVGQRVRLQVQVGVVRASVEGIARQPGRVGDVVAVHNPTSGRRLRARVLAPGVVEVLP